MPTAAVSDVIPIRKSTKRRLRDAKGDASFDDLITTLLERTPPDELAALVADKGDGARVSSGRPRDPEKQRMIADLAAKRWKLRLRDGKLRELGPRLFMLRTTPRDEGRNVRVEWPKRRG